MFSDSIFRESTEKKLSKLHKVVAMDWIELIIYMEKDTSVLNASYTESVLSRGLENDTKTMALPWASVTSETFTTRWLHLFSF